MNKTIKISLARVAFTIDEEAFKTLEEYLNTLETKFEHNANGKEILEEIEQRIAEIFSEKCPGGEVVTQTIVKSAMETLGSASQIDPGDQKQEKKGTRAQSATKKLFRDTENKMIGGVFSGFAAYFGWDVTVARIIVCFFVLGLSIPAHAIPFGSFVIIYIILCLIIPEAKTLQDRYQMKGESFTVDDISKRIEKGAAEIGRSAKEFSKKNSGFFHVLFRAICIVIGFSFLLAGAVSLVSLLLCTLGVLVIPATIMGVVAGVLGVGSSVVASIALLAIVFIPLLVLCYLGILLTFNMKAPRWKPGLWLFLLWVLSIIVFGITCAGTLASYSHSHQVESREIYPVDSSKTLTIIMEGADDDYDYVFYDGDTNDYELAIIKDKMLFVYPQINLRRDDYAQQITVNAEKTVFNKGPKRDMLYFEYSDGVLTIKPTVFNKYKEMREIGTDIDITIPSDYDIELIGTENFNFQYHTEYNNVFPFRTLSFHPFDFDFDFDF